MSADETPLPAAFERLLGAKLSPEARERAREVKDALSLRSDDAVWSLIAAFELYEALYGKHPAAIEAAGRAAVAEVKEAVKLASEREAKTAQARLADIVAATSVELAGKRVAVLGARSYGMIGVVVVALCAIGLSAGFAMGRGTAAPWVGGRGLWRAWSGVMSAPAGWLIFACMLPWAGMRLKRQWSRVGACEGRERLLVWVELLGWAIGLAAAVGCLAPLGWRLSF